MTLSLLRPCVGLSSPAGYGTNKYFPPRRDCARLRWHHPLRIVNSIARPETAETTSRDETVGAGVQAYPATGTKPVCPASQESDFTVSASQLQQLVQDAFYNRGVYSCEPSWLASELRCCLVKGLDGSGEQPVDAAIRTQRFGNNRLREAPPVSFLELVWEALQDRTLVMLIAAGGVSFALAALLPDSDSSDWIESIAILASVLIVVGVSAVTNYQKEAKFRVLNALKDDIQVRVIRGGVERTISTQQLLVGDVLVVETGDILPADGILLIGEEVRLDESHMTGEADEVIKSVSASNTLMLAGSKVREGYGRMLVLAVGERSQQGVLASMVMANTGRGVDDDDKDKAASASSESGGGQGTQMSAKAGQLSSVAATVVREETLLTQKLQVLADLIGNVGLGAAIFVFGVSSLTYTFSGALSTMAHITPLGAVQAYLDFFITGVTILVVAVPEGLPLAVTLALAFSVQRMLKDNNLVRHLDACETMASATTICSDKTGTLTANEMKVVAAWAGGKMHQTTTGSAGEASGVASQQGLPNRLLEQLRQGIMLNCTASILIDQETGVVEKIGNRTECALLEWAMSSGAGPGPSPQDGILLQPFPFTSERKRMSALVVLPESVPRLKPRNPVPCRLLTKGGADVLLEKCTHQLLPDGQVVPLPASVKQQITEPFTRQGLRVLALAYRDMTLPSHVLSYPDGPGSRPVASPGLQMPADSMELGLVLVGLLGLQDPLRADVPLAINECQRAGIVVRMLTGDNARTAASIASECGILPPGTDMDHSLRTSTSIFDTIIKHKRALNPPQPQSASASNASQSSTGSGLGSSSSGSAASLQSVNGSPGSQAQSLNLPTQPQPAGRANRYSMTFDWDNGSDSDNNSSMQGGRPVVTNAFRRRPLSSIDDELSEEDSYTPYIPAAYRSYMDQSNDDLTPPPQPNRYQPASAAPAALAAAAAATMPLVPPAEVHAGQPTAKSAAAMAAAVAAAAAAAASARPAAGAVTTTATPPAISTGTALGSDNGNSKGNGNVYADTESAARGTGFLPSVPDSQVINSVDMAVSAWDDSGEASSISSLEEESALNTTANTDQGALSNASANVAMRDSAGAEASPLSSADMIRKAIPEWRATAYDSVTDSWDEHMAAALGNGNDWEVEQAQIQKALKAEAAAQAATISAATAAATASAPATATTAVTAAGTAPATATGVQPATGSAHASTTTNTGSVQMQTQAVASSSTALSSDATASRDDTTTVAAEVVEAVTMPVLASGSQDGGDSVPSPSPLVDLVVPDEPLVLEGPQFRQLVQNEDGTLDLETFRTIWPNLRVLARCSPSDKYLLVTALKLLRQQEEQPASEEEGGKRKRRFHEVVAMTGDGTNDAPALSAADVGFAMNSGTSIAKDAADIILLDNAFSSIVSAVKWGRNVYASVTKFLQFQLTANVVAVVTAGSGALLAAHSPLSAVQMLWVNLMMDSLASLALATEAPTDELLDLPPVPPDQPLITPTVAKHILGQAAVQLLVLGSMVLHGKEWFGVDELTLDTIIFNTFVCMQLFNQFNCRKVRDEPDVIAGLFHHPTFCAIVGAEAALQVVIVQYGGAAFQTTPLNLGQWAMCVGLGATTLAVRQLLTRVPVTESTVGEIKAKIKAAVHVPEVLKKLVGGRV